MTRPPLTVDCSQSLGRLKPALHGTNLGPNVFSLDVDLVGAHQEMGFSYVRTHDCPYMVPEAVDVHAIFPLFHLDVDDPANYRFQVTDDYLQGILATGVRSISDWASPSSTIPVAGIGSTRHPIWTSGRAFVLTLSVTTPRAGRMGSITTLRTGRSGTNLRMVGSNGPVLETSFSGFMPRRLARSRPITHVSRWEGVALPAIGWHRLSTTVFVSSCHWTFILTIGTVIGMNDS